MAVTKSYIRISVKRDVTSDLVSAGGNDYEMTFSHRVFDAEQVTVATENTTTNRSFSQTGSTLTVTTTSAPSASLPIVIAFYIFITDNYMAYEKDSISTGTLTEWKPWLLRAPSVTQSIGDILEGTLNVSSSNIEFINDKSLNELIDEKTSFYNQPMKIWTDYGNGSIEEVFTGVSTNFSVGADKFTLTVKNNIVALNSIATLGDSIEGMYVQNSTPDYGKPIPFFFGTTSPNKAGQDITSSSVINSNAGDGPFWDARHCIRAVYYAYSLNPQYAIRCRSEWVQATHPELGMTLISGGGIGASTAVIEMDDLDELTQIQIGEYGANVYGGSWYSCNVDDVNLSTRRISVTTVSGNFSATVTKIKSARHVFTWVGGSDFDHGFAYWSDSTSAVGKTFPANSAGYTAIMRMLTGSLIPIYNNTASIRIDNAKHNIYGLCQCGVDTLHGEAIEIIAKGNGMTVNAASISAANSALDQNILMTIPRLEESAYDSALSYIGDILRSTFGYVYVNKAGELVYKLVDTDSSSHTITDVDIISGSLSVSYDLRDVYTKIKVSSYYYNDLGGAALSSSEFNAKEAYMTNSDRTYQYKSVLYDNGTVPQTKLNFLSRPRLKITMRIPVTFSSMEIGEFVDLTSDQLTGMDLDNLMITSITRTTTHMEITLTKIEIT